MTDPVNPGQPYGGQPYGGHPGQGGQPGEPYGTPPGQPYGGPPAPPYAAQPYGAPAPPPTAPRKSGTRKVIGIVAGALLLLLLVCAGFLLVSGTSIIDGIKSDPANAKVGNCLNASKLDSTDVQQVKNVKVVDCTSSSATYKIAGIVENKTRADFTTDKRVCGAYPSAVSALWEEGSGSTGSVLCLEPVKR